MPLPRSVGTATSLVGHLADRPQRAATPATNQPRAGRGNPLRLVSGARHHDPTVANAPEHPVPVRPAGAGKTIRVLIAAAHAVVRAGYRALLDSDHQIEVMPDVDDRRSVVGLVQDSEVDVVLLDLGLDGLDDPQAIATIVSHPALAGVAVMLIAPADSDERVLVALRAGARGVLTHDVQPAELLAGVHLLAAGQALLPARAMRRFLHELATRSRLDGRAAERFQELTDREREIVALAATGLTNTEIAERLVISTATAKTHVSRAMIKLDARHRAQLVAIAYEAGLARPCQSDRPQHAGPATAPDATSRVVELAGSW